MTDCMTKYFEINIRVSIPSVCFIYISFQTRDTYNREVCGIKGKEPINHISIPCPLNCKIMKITKKDFKIQPNGTMRIAANRTWSNDVSLIKLLPNINWSILHVVIVITTEI